MSLRSTFLQLLPGSHMSWGYRIPRQTNLFAKWTGFFLPAIKLFNLPSLPSQCALPTAAIKNTSNNYKKQCIPYRKLTYLTWAHPESCVSPYMGICMLSDAISFIVEEVLAT